MPSLAATFVVTTRSCSCLATCANPLGRRVFDHLAVALHFINTMFTAEGVMDLGEEEGGGSKKRLKR